MKNLILIFLFAANASGATYFIDFATGSDANNGTAKLTAWKRHPYMVGFTGSYSHASGDRFIFKGGVSWPSACFRLTILRGGSSDSVRDYYGVDQTWFSGANWSRPIFDAESNLQKFVFIGTPSPYANTAEFITFDNLDLRNLYWTGDPGYGGAYYFLSADGARGITLQNCYVHDWTHGQASSGTVDRMTVILGSSNDPFNRDWVIDSCLIDGGPSNAVNHQSIGMILAPFGGTVRNSTLRNAATLILLAQNCEVSHCDIGPSFNSFDPNAHDNNLNVVIGGGTQMIHDNLIHDAKSENLLCGSNSGEIDYIWNNVFWGNTEQFMFDINSSYGAKVYIWNNTIVATGAPLRVADNGPSGSLNTLSFLNNHVIYDNPSGIVSIVSSVGQYVNQNTVAQTPAQAAAQGYTSANKWQPTTSSGATVGAGQSLSGMLSGALSKDIIGTARPQGSGWDAGAYEFATGSGSIPSQPPPPAQQPPSTPTPVSPSGGITGVSVTPSLVGSSYIDPQNSPHAASEWVIKDGNGSTIVWDSGSQAASTSIAVPSSVLNYSSSYQWQVRYQNSLGLWSEYSSLTKFTSVSQTTTPPLSGTDALVFDASQGTIASPFIVSNGAISQSSETIDPNQGGKATYPFTITKAGNYAVSALVNTPGEGNNSFFVSIDAEPASPGDIWDIVSLTSGFEWRTVTHRGDQGTATSPQYSPNIWTLATGQHTLYVRGREAMTALQTISVDNIPPAPSNLRVVTAQP